MISKVCKWMISALRIGYFKIKYGKRLILQIDKNAKPIYFGKGIKLRIDKNSYIKIESGVYLSDFTTLECYSGGSIELGISTFINTYSRLIALKSITLGANCIIGTNVSIYDHDHEYRKDGFIKDQGFIINSVNIEKDVWIGTNAVVTQNTHIKEHVIIGANSIVTKNIPSRVVCAGSPAVIIKNI